MKEYVILLILSAFVSVDGMTDFLYPKHDGTVCQTMRYRSPWLTSVDVDRYVAKQPYIFGTWKVFLEFDFLESIRNYLQTSLSSTQKGIMLFTNPNDNSGTDVKVFSNFMCSYDFKNLASTKYVTLAFHICKRGNRATQQTSLFIRNLIGKIANEIPEFGNIVYTNEGIQEAINIKSCNKDPLTCLVKGLITPLNMIVEKPNFKKLILVSGLQECKDLYSDSEHSIDTLLSATLHKFPPWIKFLLISNGDLAIRKQFEHKGLGYFGEKGTVVVINLITIILTIKDAKAEGNIYTGTHSLGELRRIIQREEAFPVSLKVDNKDIKIDVREGYFQLCSGFHITNAEWNNPLRMGACIGIQGRMSPAATMGPFVELPDGSLGFITCAHLFNNIPITATIIVQPAASAFAGFHISESEKVCGVLIKKVFDPNRQTSVDAALVKIISRTPSRGLFALGSNNELLEAGLDLADIPVFDSGSIKENIPSSDTYRPVLKFGSKTGLTKGAFRLNGSQVRIATMVEFASPYNQMQNQYEIETIGRKPFCLPGDSGSGVFMLDENKQLHCIGLAIGCTNYGSTIVTPIGAVLEALGLQKKLKTFTQESMAE